jgi:hypothetical protein
MIIQPIDETDQVNRDCARYRIIIPISGKNDCGIMSYVKCQ